MSTFVNRPLSELEPGGTPHIPSARSLSLCSTSEARALVPEQVALRLNVLPLGLLKTDRGEAVSYAATGYSIQTVRELQFATNRFAKLIPVDGDNLRDAILLAYRGDERALSKAADGLCSHQHYRPQPPDTPWEIGETGPPKFLAKLIEYGFSKNASDIHLSPRPTGTLVRIRIDGKLLEHEKIIGSEVTHCQLISRLKVLANLNIQEKNLPQDGSFEVPFGSERFQVRLSVMPTIHGEQAVLRLAGSERTLAISELGLPAELLRQCEIVCGSGRGAIVVAGPTGSGKSTTLYALAKFLSSAALHVASVEDPIERRIAGMTQIQVNDDIGRTYAACLKGLLRQDPNVILIGELRDPASAQAAFQSAVTGHLVLTTVHAGNLKEIFIRLEQLGIDALSLSQALRVAIYQDLLPTLCESCKVFDLENSRGKPFDVFKPVGCNQCGYAGYAGRALVTSSLGTSPVFKEFLLERRWQTGSQQPLESLEGYLGSDSLLLELLRVGKIAWAQYRYQHETSIHTPID